MSTFKLDGRQVASSWRGKGVPSHSSQSSSVTSSRPEQPKMYQKPMQLVQSKIMSDKSQHHSVRDSLYRKSATLTMPARAPKAETWSDAAPPVADPPVGAAPLTVELPRPVAAGPEPPAREPVGVGPDGAALADGDEETVGSAVKRSVLW